MIISKRFAGGFGELDRRGAQPCGRARCVVDRACSRSAVRAGARILGFAVVWMTASPSPIWGQWNGTNPVWTNSNVGIGTASPGAALQVNGDHIVQGTFYVRNSANPSYNGRFVHSGAGGNLHIDTFGGGGLFLNHFSGANVYIGNGSSGEVATFLASGNVGIGTPSPSSLLHVSNGIGFNPSANATSSILAEGNYGGGVVLKDGNGYIGMWSTGLGTVLNFKAGGTSSGFGSPNGSMVLTSAGNLGIGTTNPQYPLAVNGTVQAKEVIVNTGWSDYVFEPTYRLRPLSEVAAFVKENHHLPDIPSEAEVKENGVSLGEMQAKLLAKIEELTLHMVNLDEANHRMEREVSDLRKENLKLRETVEGKR